MQNETYQRLTGDIAVTVVMVGLGVFLKLSPPYPDATILGLIVGVCAFLVVRLFNPTVAVIAFSGIFSAASVYGFLAGNDRAMFVLPTTGLILAVVSHYTSRLPKLTYAPVFPPKPEVEQDEYGFVEDEARPGVFVRSFNRD